MDAYSFMYGMNQRLASEGYVVLSVNYRGGTGYGLDFREPPNFGAGGASELNDILGAALYLRSRTDVDAARIGLWGGSYGGLMTALGLARAPDLLAAGVDYAGVHDWRQLLAAVERAHRAEEGASELAFQSSALATRRQVARARAAGPRRRRPQRALRADGRAGRGAAPPGCRS